MLFSFNPSVSPIGRQIVSDTDCPGEDDPKILSTGGHAVISEGALQPHSINVAGVELLAIFGYPCVFSRTIGPISQGDIVIPCFDKQSLTESGVQRPAGFARFLDFYCDNQPAFVASESLKSLDVMPVEELIINHGKESRTNVHIGYSEQYWGIPVRMVFTNNGNSREFMNMERLLLAELRARCYPDSEMSLSNLEVVSSNESAGPLMCNSLSEVRRILELHLDLWRRKGLDAVANNSITCTEEGCSHIASVFNERHSKELEFAPGNYCVPEHHTDEMILWALHNTGEYQGSLLIRGLSAIDFTVRSFGNRFGLSYGDYINKPEQRQCVIDAIRVQQALSEASLTLEVKPRIGEPLVAFSPKKILETLAADTTLIDAVLAPPQATPTEHFQSGRSSVIASMTVLSAELPLVVEVRTWKKVLLADSQPGSHRIYGLVTPGGEPTPEYQETTFVHGDDFRIDTSGNEFSEPATWTIKPDAYDGRNVCLLTLAFRPLSDGYQVFLPEQVQAVLSLRDEILSALRRSTRDEG